MSPNNRESLLHEEWDMDDVAFGNRSADDHHSQAPPSLQHGEHRSVKHTLAAKNAAVSLAVRPRRGAVLGCGPEQRAIARAYVACYRHVNCINQTHDPTVVIAHAHPSGTTKVDISPSRSDLTVRWVQLALSSTRELWHQGSTLAETNILGRLKQMMDRLSHCRKL